MDRNNLAKNAVSGLKWNYAGNLVRALCAIIINILLARLLGPEPFGLVAIASLVIGVGNLIADFGMGSALVQRDEISDDDVRYAFTVQMFVGVTLTIVVAMIAPVVAATFKEPRVTRVIQILSLVFVMQTFGVIARSILIRRLDFKRVQVANVYSYLSGYLIFGLPFAVYGWGVWSLVVAHVVQTAVASMICYASVRHRIKPMFNAAKSKLADFGSKVLLTNSVNWTISSVDGFFVAKYFDAVVVGFYNRAHHLVTTPMRDLLLAVQRVAFSSYSRMQDDPEILRKMYLATVGFMALLMVPAYGSIAVIPETVVYGLFGNEWSGATSLIMPLAIAMPFHALMAIGGPMLWARNRVSWEFRAQVMTAVFTIVALFIASNLSITAVAWSVFAVSLIRFVLITRVSLRNVQANWLEFWRSVRGGVLVSVPSCAIVAASDQIGLSLGISAPARLAVDMVAAAIFGLGTFLVARQFVLCGEMIWLCHRVEPFLPLPLKLAVNRVVANNCLSSLASVPQRPRD